MYFKNPFDNNLRSNIDAAKDSRYLLLFVQLFEEIRPEIFRSDLSYFSEHNKLINRIYIPYCNI